MYSNALKMKAASGSGRRQLRGQGLTTCPYVVVVVVVVVRILQQSCGDGRGCFPILDLHYATGGTAITTARRKQGHPQGHLRIDCIIMRVCVVALK